MAVSCGPLRGFFGLRIVWLSLDPQLSPSQGVDRHVFKVPQTSGYFEGLVGKETDCRGSAPELLIRQIEDEDREQY